jgi:hypothetical protein
MKRLLWGFNDSSSGSRGRRTIFFLSWWTFALKVYAFCPYGDVLLLLSVAVFILPGNSLPARRICRK